MPLEIKAESTTSFGKSKLQLLFWWNGFSCGTVFFQFNKRLEFDVRRGDFKIAALDLALTTQNIDYKITAWLEYQNESMDFQNNFAQLQG
jgi:hypothetical protein